MLRVFGILGIVVGIVLLISAMAGGFNPNPTRGYILGGVFLVSGIFRFVRGMNR